MENYNRFDELIRQKLDSYEAEPDMDLLVNIHARKNRFLRSRNLLTIIALLAILMAGIIGGYLIKNAGNKHSQNESDAATAGIIDTRKTAPAQNSSSNGYKPSGAQTNQQTNFPASGSTHGAVASSNTTFYNSSTADKSLKHTASRKNNFSLTVTNNSLLKYTLDKTLSDVVITANRAVTNNDNDQADEATAAKPEDNDGKKQADRDKHKNTDNCTASFEYYTSYDNSLHFMSDVTEGNTVRWQFGDGETSTEANPKHIYSKPGQYAVTLTSVNKTTNCKAEVYKLIRITKGQQLTSSTIKGNVFADAEFASKTMVQLIEYNSRFNTGKVIQTTYTNNKGYYEFSDVTAGNYIVLAASYKGYASTYYGNVAVSEAASNISIFKDDYDVLAGYDIQLLANRNPAYAGNNQNDSGAKTVIVFDNNNQPVATVRINAQGQVVSSSADLPSGDYTMVDPESGAPEGRLSVNNDGSKSTAGETSPGSDGVTRRSEVRLSPNPATNNVNVSLTNAVNSPAEVTIINYAGSVVRQFTIPDGSALNRVDINSLSGGTYYVIVKQNGVSATSTLIKSSDNSK